MKICPNCKRKTDNDNAKFCKHCGHPFPAPGTSPAPDMPPASGTSPAPQRPPKPAAQSGITLGGDIPSAKSGIKRSEANASRTAAGSATAARPFSHGPAETRHAAQEKMTFVRAISTCFAKYATFDGRAGRREYWYFWLFNVLMNILAFVAIVALAAVDASQNVGIVALGIYGMYGLVVLVPSISVFVRRMHDTGRSGAYFLLCLIPLFGPLLLLAFAASAPDPTANRYGRPV